MNEQLRQDLEATYEALESHGWCKGSVSSDGNVCLEQAIATVTLADPSFWGEPTPWTFVDYDAERVARYRDAKAALESHINQDQYDALWVWNDAVDRTVDDVKALIQRAIKANL